MSGLASPGTTASITPERLRAMASAVSAAHAHAQLAAMHLAPHAAALAPHIAHVMASAEIAANDLEEAIASGSSQRIVASRARAGAALRLLSQWGDELREDWATWDSERIGGDLEARGDADDHLADASDARLDDKGDKGWGDAYKALAKAKQRLPAGHPAHRYIDRAMQAAQSKQDGTFDASLRSARRSVQSEKMQESPQTATLSVTHAPIGKGGKNWVTRTKPGNTGQLPAYIQNIRNAIMRGGKSESEATGIAIGTVKRWAGGGGKVSPEVRAAAAKALAEWEALKAKSHGEKAVKKAA